jgi:hypothetical protein
MGSTAPFIRKKHVFISSTTYILPKAGATMLAVYIVMFREDNRYAHRNLSSTLLENCMDRFEMSSSDFLSTFLWLGVSVTYSGTTLPKVSSGSSSSYILCKVTNQRHLHRLISGRAPTIHTSLYIPIDATIFVAPNNDDINFLATTLTSFGQVNGLVTSCAKSHVAPTRILTSTTSFKLSWLNMPPSQWILWVWLCSRHGSENFTFKIWKIGWPASSSLG